MRVSAEVCVVPVGTGRSLSELIAECVAVLDAAGLTVELHAHGTNVDGEWDAVMSAIRRCHERLHERGAPRIHTTIKANTDAERASSAQEKVQHVRAHLPDEGARE